MRIPKFVSIIGDKLRVRTSDYLLNPLAVGNMELDGEISCVLMAVDIINCETRTTISLTCLITMYQSQYLSLMATEKRFPSTALEFKKAKYQIVSIQRLTRRLSCMYQNLNDSTIQVLF